MSDDMKELLETRPSLLVDKEAGERYQRVVEVAQKTFQNSALLVPAKEITQHEVKLIEEFHREISPMNPGHPYKTSPRTRSWEKEEIQDWSFFGNWEAPGMALEHIELAGAAAPIIVRELKNNLKSKIKENWARDAINQTQVINPNHIAAAAALHDEGREITHMGYSNEVIEKSLLKRIGVRADITEIIPDEAIMQVQPNESMEEAIQRLPIGAVLVRLSDEFGKRQAGTCRLLQPEDVDPKWMQVWADNYMKRQPSGRPSENFWRTEIEVTNPDGSKRRITRMQLHVNNATRYLEALDKWVRAVSTLTLSELARKINQELAPTLPPLDERTPSTSKDLLDNQVLKRKIEVGNKSLTLEALTAKGGPSKRFNEDAYSTIKDDTALQVIVVDGGTQIEQVPSLEESTGGKYIADWVVEFSGKLDSSQSIEINMNELNRFIRENEKKNHPEIIHAENSMNVPYGSISGVRIDTQGNMLEVANAGDVQIISIDKDGKPTLLAIDDVYLKDRKTFKKAKEVAHTHGVSVQYVMEHPSDPHFEPVLEEEHETMRLGNKGEILRINGFSNFRTHNQEIPLAGIKQILMFTDGAVPADIDIHTQEGLDTFAKIMREEGLEGLYKRVEEAAAEDPEFELHPRFRYLDDRLVVRLSL